MWLGIPYAQPPVGKLRWRPPRAPVPWTKPRSATTYGAACPQLGSPMVGGGRFNRSAAWTSLNVTVADEDCLFLNVFAPAPAVPLKGTRS